MIEQYSMRWFSRGVINNSVSASVVLTHYYTLNKYNRHL